MSAHNSALRCVLPAGLARGHRGNPAAVLRVEVLYGQPVLLSCLSALVLTCQELDTLNRFYKINIQRLQKLYRGTPDPVVYFLGGSLPLSALLDLRSLSLLGMISQLGPSHILHKIGCSILSSSKPSRHLWFSKIRVTCRKYTLPDPLVLLSNPPPKLQLKKLMKSKVIQFWENKLRQAAAHCPPCSISSLSSILSVSPTQYG